MAAWALALALASGAMVACSGDPSLRRYVAVGDSYSSGSGLEGAHSSPCDRSRLAFPHLVKLPPDATRQVLACGGATVATLVAEQLPRIDRRADLVTITIGGNDVGFAPVMRDCVIGLRACTRRDGAVEERLDRLREALPAAFLGVLRRAPDASVVVLGYAPPLADPDAVKIDRCRDAAAPGPIGLLRISPSEARWIRDKAGELNDVIAGAARRAGLVFVDPSARFSGHEVCSDDPFVAGVRDDGGAPFHPTRAGHEQLARAVEDAID